MDPWLIASLLSGRLWVQSLARLTLILRVLTTVFIQISAESWISTHPNPLPLPLKLK